MASKVAMDVAARAMAVHFPPAFKLAASVTMARRAPTVPRHLTAATRTLTVHAPVCRPWVSSGRVAPRLAAAGAGGAVAVGEAPSGARTTPTLPSLLQLVSEQRLPPRLGMAAPRLD